MADIHTRRSALSLLAGAAVLSQSGLLHGQEKRTIKLLLDWTWWSPHLPLVIAKELGFFDKAGLNVEFRQGTGSGTTSQVVGQGTSDIGHVGLTSAAQAIAKGVPIRAVASISYLSGSGMIFRPGLIKRPSDVIGKRIGSTAGGSDSQILPAFLAANKIDLGQVQIVNMPGEAKLGALIAGQIDIASADAFYFAALAAEKGVMLDQLSYGQHGANVIGYGFVASENYIKSNPDNIQRFVVSAMEGYRYAETNLEESIKIFRKVTGTSQTEKTIKDVYQGYLKMLNFRAEARGGAYNGRNDPVVWTQTLDILGKYAGLNSPKPQSEYWTNQFVGG